MAPLSATPLLASPNWPVTPVAPINTSGPSAATVRWTEMVPETVPKPPRARLAAPASVKPPSVPKLAVALPVSASPTGPPMAKLPDRLPLRVLSPFSRNWPLALLSRTKAAPAARVSCAPAASSSQLQPVASWLKVRSSAPDSVAPPRLTSP